ncbi:hypothetical protein CDD83_8823 [Cordyceps sp. RAO-2017]|nr:hypothetical protein CDD83_8823 [Cordyceps sp. RAO-2017]
MRRLTRQGTSSAGQQARLAESIHVVAICAAATYAVRYIENGCSTSSTDVEAKGIHTGTQDGRASPSDGQRRRRGMASACHRGGRLHLHEQREGDKDERGRERQREQQGGREGGPGRRRDTLPEGAFPALLPRQVTGGWPSVAAGGDEASIGRGRSGICVTVGVHADPRMDGLDARAEAGQARRQRQRLTVRWEASRRLTDTAMAFRTWTMDASATTVGDRAVPGPRGEAAGSEAGSYEDQAKGPSGRERREHGAVSDGARQPSKASRGQARTGGAPAGSRRHGEDGRAAGGGGARDDERTVEGLHWHDRPNKGVVAT